MGSTESSKVIVPVGDLPIVTESDGVVDHLEPPDKKRRMVRAGTLSSSLRIRGQELAPVGTVKIEANASTSRAFHGRLGLAEYRCLAR